MSFTYYNPVKIHYNTSLEDTLALISGELPPRILLVTSQGWLMRGISKRIESALPSKSIHIISDISPNPELAHLQALKAKLSGERAIIALGGGSVLDSAKFFAMQGSISAGGGELHINRQSGQGRAQDTQEARQEQGKEPTTLPLFAFPTTAGTSSELTQWATIWDSAARVKYSLSHPALYPQMAAYDMSLFVSLPREVLLHTTLDSLSHACEAIWNKNANPISTHHALHAIELILAHLPRLLGDLGDCVARDGLVRASIHAGLAFSNTQTALAHAISYPITMESGVPHGLACSFSLPLLCECIIDEAARSTLEPYKAEIARLFDRLGVSTRARDYGLDSARIEMIFEKLNARAKNGLLDIERAKAGLKSSAK